MDSLRVCFIGDSTTLGTGDSRLIGWPGRVCAAAQSEGHDITIYNLGVRGETSEEIARRWREEASRRLLAGMNCVVVFSFGLNDCVVENDVTRRVELHRTAQNTRAILRECKGWLPSLFVSPAPVDDASMPRHVSAEKKIRVVNADLGEVSNLLADVASEHGVPYLDLFTPLMEGPEWHALMQRGAVCIRPPLVMTSLPSWCNDGRPGVSSWVLRRIGEREEQNETTWNSLCDPVRPCVPIGCAIELCTNRRSILITAPVLSPATVTRVRCAPHH